MNNKKPLPFSKQRSLECNLSHCTRRLKYITVDGKKQPLHFCNTHHEMFASLVQMLPLIRFQTPDGIFQIAISPIQPEPDKESPLWTPDKIS